MSRCPSLFLCFLGFGSLCTPAVAQGQAKPELTILHAFAQISESHSLAVSPANADGANPSGAVCLGKDGSLYGTASRGGANGQGVLFRLNPEGIGFQVLHSFQALPMLFAGAPNENGAYPSGALVQGSEGDLYGTASQGGPGGGGTIYAIRPDGTGFRVIHAFGPMQGQFLNEAGHARRTCCPVRMGGSTGRQYLAGRTEAAFCSPCARMARDRPCCTSFPPLDDPKTSMRAAATRRRVWHRTRVAYCTARPTSVARVATARSSRWRPTAAASKSCTTSGGTTGTTDRARMAAAC